MKEMMVRFLISLELSSSYFCSIKGIPQSIGPFLYILEVKMFPWVCVFVCVCVSVSACVRVCVRARVCVCDTSSNPSGRIANFITI